MQRHLVEFRERQEVVHERLHAVRRARQQADQRVEARAVGEDFRIAQERDGHRQRRERRAEFVDHEAEEAFALALQLAQGGDVAHHGHAGGPAFPFAAARADHHLADRAVGMAQFRPYSSGAPPPETRA